MLSPFTPRRARSLLFCAMSPRRLLRRVILRLSYARRYFAADVAQARRVRRVLLEVRRAPRVDGFRRDFTDVVACRGRFSNDVARLSMRCAAHRASRWHAPHKMRRSRKCSHEDTPRQDATRHAAVARAKIRWQRMQVRQQRG